VIDPCQSELRFVAPETDGQKARAMLFCGRSEPDQSAYRVHEHAAVVIQRNSTLCMMSSRIRLAKVGLRQRAPGEINPYQYPRSSMSVGVGG
jgi:hypothetical protein